MRRYTDPGSEPPRNFHHHRQYPPDSSSPPPPPQQPVYYYKQPTTSGTVPRKAGGVNPRPPFGFISQYQESIYSHHNNRHPQRSLNYRIEIRSSKLNFKKHELESLVGSCKPQPNHFVVFNKGYIAARLFYKHRYAALDALANLWEKRLLVMKNGNFKCCFAAHLMTNVGSDSLCYEMDDVRERLGGVFMEYCEGLLKGEVVHGMRRKVEEKNGRVKRVEWLLERLQKMEVLERLRAEKKGLEEEVELVYMRLDEFRAGLECIIRSLNGGGRTREDDAEVLRLRNGNGNEVNWVEVHCCIMRECRRLEDGLPIYGFRREILSKIQSEQV